MFVWSFAAGVVGPGALIVEGHLRPPPPKLLARSGAEVPRKFCSNSKSHTLHPALKGIPHETGNGLQALGAYGGAPNVPCP